MAQGKKTSSQKKAEVIGAKIANPDLSLRDIEKATGIKKSTAKDIIDKDLPLVRTSSDIVKELLEKDLKLLDLIQSQKFERMVSKEVNDSDIDKWENTANKRRLLFEDKDEGDSKQPIIIQI